MKTSSTRTPTATKHAILDALHGPEGTVNGGPKLGRAIVRASSTGGTTSAEVYVAREAIRAWRCDLCRKPGHGFRQLSDHAAGHRENRVTFTKDPA